MGYEDWIRNLMPRNAGSFRRGFNKKLDLKNDFHFVIFKFSRSLSIPDATSYKTSYEFITGRWIIAQLTESREFQNHGLDFSKTRYGAHCFEFSTPKNQIDF